MREWARAEGMLYVPFTSAVESGPAPRDLLTCGVQPAPRSCVAPWGGPLPPVTRALLVRLLPTPSRTRSLHLHLPFLPPHPPFPSRPYSAPPCTGAPRARPAAQLPPGLGSKLKRPQSPPWHPAP